MHKKSQEIAKKPPGTPESTHSDSYSEEHKVKDSETTWSSGANGADDSEDMAIDLSSTSKQESKSTLKRSPPRTEDSSDSETESWLCKWIWTILKTTYSMKDYRFMIIFHNGFVCQLSCGFFVVVHQMFEY